MACGCDGIRKLQKRCTSEANVFQAVALGDVSLILRKFLCYREFGGCQSRQLLTQRWRVPVLSFSTS